MSAPLLEVRNIVRRFGALRAVDGVSITVAAAPDAPPIAANGRTRYRGRSATMRSMVWRGLHHTVIDGEACDASASDDMTDITRPPCFGATAGSLT